MFNGIVKNIAHFLRRRIHLFYYLNRGKVGVAAKEVASKAYIICIYIYIDMIAVTVLSIHFDFLAVFWILFKISVEYFFSKGSNYVIKYIYRKIDKLLIRTVWGLIDWLHPVATALNGIWAGKTDLCSCPLHSLIIKIVIGMLYKTFLYILLGKIKINKYIFFFIVPLHLRFTTISSQRCIELTFLFVLMQRRNNLPHKVYIALYHVMQYCSLSNNESCESLSDLN